MTNNSSDIGHVRVRSNVVAVYPVGAETMADATARARRDWRGVATIIVRREGLATLLRSAA